MSPCNEHGQRRVGGWVGLTYLVQAPVSLSQACRSALSRSSVLARVHATYTMFTSCCQSKSHESGPGGGNVCGHGVING